MGRGGVSRSYANVATLWAWVTPVSARAVVDADALGADVTHRVVIRTRGDITTHHRFQWGSRVLRIVALRDEDGTGRFLEIDADERTD